MIKLFTHNDLDGVGCAIIAKLAKGVNAVDVEYVDNPQELTKRMRSYIDDGEHTAYTATWVTDLSADTAVLTDVPNLLLVDHHKSALPLVDALPHKNILVRTHAVTGEQICATKLLNNLLQPKPSQSLFVNMVDAYDTWAWTNGTSRLPAYLSMLVYALGVEEFERVYVDRLRANTLTELTLFTERERIMLTAIEHNESMTTRRAADSATVVDVNGLRVAVLFAGGNTSDIGHMVIKDQHADVVLMVDPVNCKVSLRSAVIDVSNVAAQLFTGGGHTNAAGGRLQKQDAKVLKNLLTTLADNVGRHIHHAVLKNSEQEGERDGKA